MSPITESAQSVKPDLDKNKFILFILTLGILTAVGPLSIDMYLPAFPKIAAFLNSPLHKVELSLASFFIGISFGQLVYGFLTDRFGRKKPLYIGLTLYMLASIACAFAVNIESLVVLRFLQALGACAGMVVSRAVVRDLFNQQDSAKVFSLLLLVMGVAPIVAPLLGGYISKFYSWQAIFILLSVFSAFCLALIFFLLPETKQPNPAVKLNKVFSTYTSILKDRHFLGYALSGGLASGALFAYITGSPYVFIEMYHISEEDYGWIFGSNALGLITFSQINTRLLKSYSTDTILNVCYTIFATLGVLLAIIGFFEVSLWVIIVPLFCFLAITGMTNPNSSASALATQGDKAGSASALLGTIQFVMGAISAGIISSIHDGTARPMTLTLGICGLLSFIFYKTLCKKPN